MRQSRTLRVRLTHCLPVALLLTGGLAPGLRAQLISPGKLSAAHASLEGMRSCTTCHELGKKGASSSKCLQCHEPLRTRVAAGRGYHASVRTQECTDCHKEHFGREFALVRLDTASFDHGRTGYRLTGAHQDARCRACHAGGNIRAADVAAWTRKYNAQPAQTFLGLATTCSACHAPDDPHRGQFRGRCDDCHSPTTWAKPDRFNHARTAYPLTGEHRQVACDGCHKTEHSGNTAFVRFVGVTRSTCASCHRDPHSGAMGTACASCHQTSGFTQVDQRNVAGRFNHERTRFPLNGRHATVACNACHGTGSSPPGIHIRFAGNTRTASFPRPVLDGCNGCHQDYHDGVFAGMSGAGSCAACHSENGWEPASFDIERHNDVTAFPLTGAHLVTPCTSCHGGNSPGEKPHFQLPQHACASCHQSRSPHGERFGGRGCAECHETATFRVTGFDHAKAAGETCRSCHQSRSPHGGQFGDTDCNACHDTRAYRIERFDHARARFPLNGAHARVACSGCHKADSAGDSTIVRYRPLQTECGACHGGGR